MSLGCMCLLLLSFRVLSRRIFLRGNALIEAFLAAFFKARASFRLGADHTSTIQFKGSPTIHPTGFEFEVVG